MNDMKTLRLDDFQLLVMGELVLAQIDKLDVSIRNTQANGDLEQARFLREKKSTLMQIRDQIYKAQNS